MIAFVVVAVLGFLLYLNQVCTPDWKLIKLNSSLKELGNMLYSQWPRGIPEDRCFSELLESAPPQLKLGRVCIGDKNPLPEFLPGVAYGYEMNRSSKPADKSRVVCWTELQTRRGRLYLAIRADWGFEYFNQAEWDKQSKPPAP